MVLLTKAISIYFDVNPSTFLPVTGSKIKIDECTFIIGFLTYARRRNNNS